MTVPLQVLAFLAVIAGMFNLPEFLGGTQWLGDYLNPVFSDAQPFLAPHTWFIDPLTEWLLLGVTVVYVVVMIITAYSRFVKKQLILDDEAVKRNFLQNIIMHKFYVDELYDHLFVKPMMRFSDFLGKVFDTKVIDRVVTGTGRITQRAGNTIRYIQTGHVGTYLFYMVISIIAILVINLLLI